MTAPHVMITTVGLQFQPDISWPEGWPPPREGETVALLYEDTPQSLIVRRVVWYPHDPEGPFIYVVVGPTARQS